MHDLPFRPLVVACLAAWLPCFGLAGGPSLLAQEAAAEVESPEVEAPEVEAPEVEAVKPEAARPRRPFANALATAAGTRRYAPNKWGIVAVDLYNPTDQPAELLVTSYLNHDQGLQFGRRMWVPAGTRRASWYPIKVPPIADAQRDSVDVGSLLEILSQPGAGPDSSQQPVSTQQVVARRSESGLMLDRGNVVSGLVLNRDPNPMKISWPYESVIAARACQQQSRQLALLESGPLPPTPEALDALDQLVVASDRVAEDAAAMRAIRTWLVRGGRLWLMLDQLSPEVATRLAGDHLAWQEVDRVGLTTIHVEGTEVVPYLKDEVFELEQPETQVRVLVTGARVSHTLDGWPAAFWLDVGRGQMLVTTVGPRAWIRRRTGADPRPRSVLQDTNYYPRPPLEQLAGEFFAPPQPALFEAADTVPYLSEQIGYRTLPRPVLAAILGSFCLLVVGGAAWFMGRGRGELLAAGVAGTAVLVTALIAGLGWATRSAVPQSVASFQLLDAVPDQSELNVVGSLGLYNPVPLDEPLGSERGGLLWPDMTGLQGTTRRLIFSDLDRFAWDNLRLPPGVRLAAVETTAPLAGPLRAWASFQESGLQGQLRAADAVELSDAVIATPSGRLLAVRIDAEGHFEATADGVFARGQYSAEALLSDEGRRRRDLYARLLDPERIDRLIRRPSLLVWAAARPLPLRL
ncbi:MAG: hypothetical protein J5I93_26455, partial [Pirellulaceae bacterium]|nr:hypothetical protein [Pirellulaceae bacterium]